MHAKYYKSLLMYYTHIHVYIPHTYTSSDKVVSGGDSTM